MKVIQTIQSTINPDEAPGEVTYYTGDDFLEATHAVVTAMRDAASDFKYSKTVAIRIEL